MCESGRVGAGADHSLSYILDTDGAGEGPVLPAGAQETIQFVVQFDANGVDGSYNNEATITGQDALGRDLENDTVESVALSFAQADLLVDKELVEITVISQLTFQATFEVQIANSGEEFLSGVQIVDDVTLAGWDGTTNHSLVTLAPRDPSIFQSTAVGRTSNLTFNTNYLTAGDHDLLAASGTMDPGSTATIRFTIEFDVSDTSFLPLENRVEATATDANSQVAGGEDEVQFTPEVLEPPQLVVQKNHDDPTPVPGPDGFFDVDFQIDVTNPSMNDLYNLSIIDDIFTSMGSGLWDSFSLEAIHLQNVTTGSDETAELRTAASLLADPASNWLTRTDYQLTGGHTLMLTFTVRFNANGDLGPYTNTVEVRARDFLAREFSSGSQAPVALTIDSPGLHVDKEHIRTTVIDQNLFESTFTLQVTNGSEESRDVVVSDDLLGNGWNAAIHNATGLTEFDRPIIMRTSTLSEDTAPGSWTTSTSETAIAIISSLPADSAATFEIIVRYFVPNATQGLLPITNIASVEGEDASGTMQTSSDAVVVLAEDLVGDRGGPELVVEKDGLNPRPVAGQPGWFDADFTVTLSNPSVETLWNVEFIDDFASGLCSGAWTGCTLAADPVGTNITLKSAFVINLIGGVWTETAQSIPAGGEARVDYTVRFQANGDLGPYTNIVTVTGEESLGNRTISAEGREAAIILLDSPGVTVDKELISTQVMGQNAFRSVFTLQVTNGSEVLTDVDLLDDLATGWAAATTTAEITDITLLVQDPGATWVLATPPTSGATALVAETASWPADDSATFQITVDYTVANGATGDLPITNIATITGLNAASIAETSTDAVTISADQLTGDRGDAQLVIDKDAGIVRKASDSDPALSAFFDVDFTVTFTNPSDETAFNLVLVDDLPTTLGAGPWNSFEVQTIAATGVTTQTAATINGDFTANWLMPNQDLAPGASATVTFTVRFHSGVAPMQSGDLGPYTNVATITAEDALGDRNIQAVSQTDVQILLDNPSAHIDKEIYRTEVIDQNTFITTFRLQATNGAEPLTNAVISDDLNDIFYNGWAAAHDTSLINDPDVVVMNTAILVEDTPTGQWTTSTDPAALATIALWPANDSITLEIQVRYTVRPDDGLSGAADTDGGDAGELPISNIARITGTDPAGNPVVSEDAVSLTADQLRGDRGGPQLVIDKDGGVVRPAANGAIGFFDVDFTVSITNPSDETAWNLALIDDLNTSMGTGDWDNFSVVDITATGVTPQSSLLINFNEASWATYNWLAPGQHLAAGATARVNYTVRFELVDDFDANTPQFGPYTNLVTLTAEDALGTPAPSVADAFDRAIVVTATEDAQIFLDAPGIEIDKEHVATQMTSQQNFTSIFTLQVINGSEDLANATLNDDLLTGWAAAVAGTVQVTAIDVVADNSGGAWTPTTTPITGGAITASTQLASTTLVPADSATTFRIEVAYQTTAATQANLPIRNTATLQGQSPAGDDLIVADYAEVLELELTGDKVAALDIKKSLARPVFQILVEDPDMVPTVQPLLTGGQPTYQADFVLYAENRGQQILHMVQISDDLIATFGAGNIVSVSTPVISGDLSLAATPAFDGQGNNDLLAGTEELDVGEDTTVTFSVQFTASSPISSLTNTAVLTAQDMFGNVLTDDDDVPLGVPALDITKTVIALDDSDSANDNYTVTFSLTATNIGNINLTNVQISDDFQSQLTLLTGGVGSVDTTQVDVVAASISTTGTGTFGDNNLFKANIQNPFLFGGASNLCTLDVGQSVTAEIIIAFNSGGFQGLIDNVAVAGADSDGDVTRDVFAIDDEAINIGGTAAIWRATIDKAFIGPAVNTSGTLFEVPFEIEIANTGTRELDNVQLLDDIAAQLLAQHGPAITLNSIKPGTLSLDATNAIGSTLTLNTGYTGASPNHNLLTNNPTAVFQPGDTYVFAFTAIVDNTGFVADFDNEANLIASRRQSPDQGQEPWIDITDRVNVPLLMPDLTIMKLVESNQQVSGTTHDVIFYVLITNSGNAPLSVANGLSLKDDLATQMTNQGATLTSVTVPMLTPLNTNTGGSALVLNPSFDAGLTVGNDEALASGTLEVGDGYELRFRARVEVPATLGQVTNTAVTEAQGVDPKDASAIVLLAQPDPNTFLITKRADRTTASVGDIILYTLTGLNQLNLERKIDIVDTLPVGFTYVAGSATYNGVADEPTIVGQVLTWEDKEIDAANDADPAAVKGYTIIFAALVTPAAQPGDYVNRHQIFDPYSGLPLSPVAIATVHVIADPTFDCSDIIGRVFNDLNRDGYPDPGEPGIAAARVVTVNGLSITADAHGRFHVACGAIPDSLRGSNFIMKLDERSLPAGYRITSENPRVVRLTRGKVTKVNFGASISQVYRVDLDDQAFVPNQIKLNDAYRPALMQLIDQLAQSNSVLRITYHTRFGKSALTQARVNAIAKFVRAKVTAKGTGHSLKIEPEIIRALGSSKAIQPKVQQQTITKRATTTYIQPKGQLSNTQGATQVPQSEWQGKYVVPKGYILMRRQDGKLFLRKTN